VEYGYGWEVHKAVAFAFISVWLVNIFIFLIKPDC
jgi:hypothetical protein